jgi:tetratricopeptide (TPR) repeat protein
MKKLLFLIPFLPIITFAQSAVRYLELGNEKLDSSKYNEAISYYNNAIALNFTYTPAYWGKLKAHVRMGDRKSEIEDLNIILKIDPWNTTALDMRALNKYLLEDYPGAIVDYSSLIRLQPNSKDIVMFINWRAKAKVKLKDYKGAIQDFELALAKDDKTPENELNDIGIAKMDLKDFNGAIDDFTESIAKKTDYSSYMNRGTAKRGLGNYDEAVEDYTQAIAICPHGSARYPYYNNILASCYANRGEVNQQKKDYKAALADFEQALALNSTSGRTYTDRGDTKNLLGDKEGACTDWSIAVNMGYKTASERISKFCK